jgi:o-succinylbenzoate---CoA ligase
VPRLVVLDASPGPAFVDGLRRAWDGGDAVLPVDPRLAPSAARALVDRLAGTTVADGDALVLATSGTTGAPKAVVHGHEGLRWAADTTNAALGVDPATDRWLVQLPLAHVGGLGVVTRALLGGIPLTFEADDRRATLTAAVPTQLERNDHARFRAVLVGGSADWRRQRGANVVRTYGLTESYGGVVYDGVPLPGVDVRVVDGEVQLRCGSLLRRYGDGTVPLADGGWLPTGDEGRWDGAAGRLHVEGRRGDVVVTGGEKVWPEPVEQVLRTVEGVLDVAVVGRPDPEWGQAVTAVVVAADPAAPPSLDALRGAVRDVLPPWCAPTRLELRDHLPRTPIGKVRRSALRDPG